MSVRDARPQLGSPRRGHGVGFSGRVGLGEAAETRERRAAPGELDPESCGGFLRSRARPALPLIVECIREHAGRREERDNGGLRWGVEPICAGLSEHGMPVAPSTYYAHVNRQATVREHRDALLLNRTAGSTPATTACTGRGGCGWP